MPSFATSKELVARLSEHKLGRAIGIPSICSSNPFVLQACMRKLLDDQGMILIESTCNQINQYGGYTGLTPTSFAEQVKIIAREINFPWERILLGGDHLGPFPWKREPAAQALAKSEELVSAYVNAGYQKIHIDASMHCADDDLSYPLTKEINAQRTSRLVKTAELAHARINGDTTPVYVIGTEVPVPGGSQNEDGNMVIPGIDDIAETLQIFRREFYAKGLQSAWDRVVAVVVQPGVEFGNEYVFAYSREKANHLSRFIESIPGIVYEAHSTDYQQRHHLKQLVEDHFAILKVGPELTFSFRKAIFALARMEFELLGKRNSISLSRLIEIIDQVMIANPDYWQSYYQGDPTSIALARKYSLSDRIRYYWSFPAVIASINQLFTNLVANPLPPSLVNEFLPNQYQRILVGNLKNNPSELIWDYISETFDKYLFACTE